MLYQTKFFQLQVGHYSAVHACHNKSVLLLNTPVLIKYILRFGFSFPSPRVFQIRKMCKEINKKKDVNIILYFTDCHLSRNSTRSSDIDTFINHVSVLLRIEINDVDNLFVVTHSVLHLLLPFWEDGYVYSVFIHHCLCQCCSCCSWYLGCNGLNTEEPNAPYVAPVLLNILYRFVRFCVRRITWIGCSKIGLLLCFRPKLTCGTVVYHGPRSSIVSSPISLSRIFVKSRVATEKKNTYGKSMIICHQVKLLLTLVLYVYCVCWPRELHYRYLSMKLKSHIVIIDSELKASIHDVITFRNSSAKRLA